MTIEERNMELMQTLDDAWNAQDVEVFRQRHKPDVLVRWPGKPPTHGIEDHTQESIEFWQTFPDQHLDNRPYRVFFASGDWTCSIAGLDLLYRPLHRHYDRADEGSRRRGDPTHRQVVRRRLLHGRPLG